ncbi:uncharacterized protein LOC124364773 [Homalodisca vitripennis]|uniref:uncharacterized protein LOC124364773 n=1 Tax=Homalodisca vitripennis TaxID=197043 RepID=UPI001EEAB452|nr:uncharacterized protein LOC124364773 [Homalodisca vitripennis]
MFLFVILYIFSGWIVNENQGVYKDLVRYREYEFTYVKLKPNLDYDNEFVVKLDQGVRVTDFLTAIYNRFVSNRPLCDFQTIDYPTTRAGYKPATCVHEATCSETYNALGEWSNKTCQLFANNERGGHAGYLCCPVEQTVDYQRDPLVQYYPSNKDQRVLQFREVPPTFKMYEKSPYTALLQRNAAAVKNHTILEKVFEQQYKEKMQSALVCEFRKGDVILPKSQSSNHEDVREIILFFCTKPAQCRRSPDKAPHYLSRYFCANVIKFDYTQAGRSVCCQDNDILPTFFGTNAAPVPVLRLPQLPTYLKYAPGLRSAFKCEEYSKKGCERPSDECFYQDTPHFVSLGFVAPKFMMYHCGGALISRRYFLSTHRCRHFFGFVTNVALLGEHTTSNVDVNERIYVVDEIRSYQKSGFDLKPGETPPDEVNQVDLALYRASKEVKLFYNIRPACIFHTAISTTNVLEFTGFGPNQLDLYRTEKKKTLSLRKINKVNCSSKNEYDVFADPYYGRYGVTKDYMMCYHDTTSSPTNIPCKYDKGGPLQYWLSTPVCSTAVLGILSSNREDCSNSARGHVFINVTKFIKQIEDAVWGQFTFLDLFDKDLQRPHCRYNQNLMFFNRPITESKP